MNTKTKPVVGTAIPSRQPVVGASIPSRKAVKPAGSIASLMANASKAVDDRFTNSALAQHPAPRQGTEPVAFTTAPQLDATGFDVSACRIGQVYPVPLHLIDFNKVGARYFYRNDNLSDIEKSIESGGQEVAANGFVSGNRIHLIDGGSRLKSARASGLATLDVKIDKQPANLREQFKRSVALNDIRSTHTALDLAVNLKRMLEDGIYTSQEEFAADMANSKGGPLGKSRVSELMRISRIPERLLQMMSEHDQTSAHSIAYEVSGIFTHPDYEKNKERFTLIAEDVIELIQTKNLSRAQTTSLLAAKLSGKERTRQSSETSVIRFGGTTGKLKAFPGRGQILLSLAGLTSAEFDDLRDRIQQALAGQLPL